MENTRTLAVQLDAELFDEFDAYLKKNKFKKRNFITDLIRKVLEEAKQAEASEGEVAPTDGAGDLCGKAGQMCCQPSHF